MNSKFKILNDVKIIKDPGIIDYKCETLSCVSEIINAIDNIGQDKIALLWVCPDMVYVICKCKFYDGSFVVPELSRHNFIGHLAGIATFYNGSIGKDSYRIFIKDKYICEYENSRQ